MNEINSFNLYEIEKFLLPDIKVNSSKKIISINGYDQGIEFNKVLNELALKVITDLQSCLTSFKTKSNHINFLLRLKSKLNINYQSFTCINANVLGRDKDFEVCFSCIKFIYGELLRFLDEYLKIVIDSNEKNYEKPLINQSSPDKPFEFFNYFIRKGGFDDFKEDFCPNEDSYRNVVDYNPDKEEKTIMVHVSDGEWEEVIVSFEMELRRELTQQFYRALASVDSKMDSMLADKQQSANFLSIHLERLSQYMTILESYESANKYPMIKSFMENLGYNVISSYKILDIDKEICVRFNYTTSPTDKLIWTKDAKEFVKTFSPLIQSESLKYNSNSDTDPIVKKLHTMFLIEKNRGAKGEISVTTLCTYFKLEKGGDLY